MSEQVQTYSIINIILLQSNFERDWIINLTHSEFTNHTDIKVTSQRSPEHLSVTVSLLYSAGIKGGKTEVKADIKMVGIFTVPTESELPIDVFTNVNAPAIIFPFLREHLASISAKSGISPIMLQPINFVKNIEGKQDKMDTKL